MADKKGGDDHAHGGGFADKGLIAIVLIILGSVALSNSSCTIGGGANRGPSSKASSSPGRNWQDHGPNSLCEDRPKGVSFTCTPPGSNRPKTCVCN